MIKPDLEFVYEATGDLEPPVPIGTTYDGTRRIIPIVGGGRVEGPKIKGKLVGNAADWQSPPSCEANALPKRPRPLLCTSARTADHAGSSRQMSFVDPAEG